MEDLAHVSLFSGIGGLDIAAEWAGLRTVAQVERDPYCLGVLRRHWPRVPKFSDIRRVSGDALRRACGGRGTVVLSGGFPCQPFSCAGKQRGAADDRYLWPEMLRVVQELRPAWVVGENVPGLISMALDDVLSDLDSAGYTCRAVVFPAAAVGAWHRRERVFIIAADSRHHAGSTKRIVQQEIPEEFVAGGKGQLYAAQIDADSASERRERHGRIRNPIVGKPHEASILTRRERKISGSFWSIEPPLGRVANGVPHRMDRLRALGNAVVPQQAYPVFAAIAKVEMNGGGQ